MLSYSEFSGLRIETLFPDAPEVVRNREMFGEPGERSSFDWEYAGGMWCLEAVAGVNLWYPEVEPDLVGAVELMPANPGEGARSNADLALSRLGLPIRFGADEASVRALAGDAPISLRRNEERGLSGLSFILGDEALYDVEAIVSDAEGLVSLEIQRPDLVNLNADDEDDEDEGED